MITAKEIGRRMKELRGVTPRKKVADGLNISPSAIAMYENGERIPRDEVKMRIAAFYGLTVQELFFDEECHIK